MRFHAGFYQRHRTRTLVALRLLVPMCMLGSWLSSPRRRDLPTQIIVFSRLLIGRGLHSSTFRLNVSALCGTGGALRGCQVVFGGCQRVSRVNFVSAPAEVELRKWTSVCPCSSACSCRWDGSSAHS